MASLAAERRRIRRRSGDYPWPGIELPSRLLLQWPAALAHVFRLSGTIELFDVLNTPPGGEEPAVPGKTGDAFMDNVVDYEGEAITKLESEAREHP
ncbi:hypothetical protein C8T65DRAFT_740723 [Cerioporus squamosus]|nr:hypothetical protein C8T65DRAFT_740723 [Cerioporus squamosus]